MFVLSDLDLGMNQWMTEEFEYPDVDMDRGKVLWEEDLEKLEKRWGRYLDVDGDGIPYRTLPGNKNTKAAYFARGTGHDEYARYTEDAGDWERNMARLVKKFETARTIVPKPEITGNGKAPVGLIFFGSTEPAVKEAGDLLQAEGVEVDYMRVRSLPFSKEVKKFIEAHDRNYVIELNRDGQLHQILKIEYPELTDKMTSMTKHDGLPLSATWTFNAVKAEEAK